LTNVTALSRAASDVPGRGAPFVQNCRCAKQRSIYSYALTIVYGILGGGKDMNIGYARVSTREQNVALQVDALKAAGCTKVALVHG
jgi:Resolvase, N terminal domain